MKNVNNKGIKMINPLTIEKMVNILNDRKNAEYILIETEDGDEYWFMMTVGMSGKKARVGIYDCPDLEADCYAEEIIRYDDSDIKTTAKKMLEEFQSITHLEV